MITPISFLLVSRLNRVTNPRTALWRVISRIPSPRWTGADTTGGRTIRYQIHNLLFLFGIKRNRLRSGKSQSLYLFIRRGIKQIIITIGAYHF